MSARLLAGASFVSLVLVALPVFAQDETPAPAPQPPAPEPTPEPPPPESAPPPADAPPVTAPPPPPKKTVPVVRFDGGFAMRRLESIPITGGDLGIAIGAERPWIAYIASVSGTFGSTENNLGVRSGHLMFETDLILDRFRFGLGLGVMFLGFDRALREETIYSSGLIGRASMRLDLVRLEGTTVFARAKIDYSAVMDGEDAAYWGPTFGAGVDFDLVTRTR